MTNLWQDITAEADKARTTNLKGLEGDCQKGATEKLIDVIYDKTNKKYKMNQLKQYKDELLADGVEGFGTKRITELITAYSLGTATPEQKKLVPVLEGIKNDPAKLKEFSTTLVREMLGTIAYKNPKLLERMFTQDERDMKALLGDVLPDLIEQAYNDPARRDKAEAAFGKKMTKRDLGEKLKNIGWKNLWWILLVLGIIGGGGIFLATRGG